MWRTTETYCVWLALVGCKTKIVLETLWVPPFFSTASSHWFSVSLQELEHTVGIDLGVKLQHHSQSLDESVTDYVVLSVSKHACEVFSLCGEKNRGIVRNTSCTSSQVPWASLQKNLFLHAETCLSGHVKTQIIALEKSAQRIADPSGVHCCIRK